MKLIWSVAFWALLPVASQAEEPIGIKGINLGMSVAALQDLLATDIYCESAPMDAFAYCATTANLDEGRSGIFAYPMTIAGQDCELRAIRADNDGLSNFDTAELFIFEVDWSCDSSSDVIERALRRKFGKPTSEDASDVKALGSTSSVTSVTWEFRSDWEKQPRKPSESEFDFRVRAKLPKQLTLYTGGAPTYLNLRDRRVNMLVQFRKERREAEDI